jgi:hypothetical protein
MYFLTPTRGLGSSVGIATDYGLDGPEIESRWGKDFSHVSRPAVGTHPLLVPRLRMARAIPLPPLQGHEACYRVNYLFYCYTQL